jgi:predicted transcriptional regulator
LRRGDACTRRSRFESYQSILEALVGKPLTLCGLSLATGLDFDSLRQYLESLLANGLIEQRPAGEAVFYAITEKGLALVRTLDFQEYLRRIRGAAGIVDEALEIIPEICGDHQEIRD